MKNIIKILLVVLAALPMGLQAQSTCADQMKLRKPTQPYRYNSASKSAMCQTGRKYEFVLPITKGLEYRIQFFASTVFNNNVDVKIIDMSTGEVVINVPGRFDESKEVKFNQQTALQDYFDEKKNKYFHPYFDFAPVSSTSLKIMLDVKEVEVPQDQVQGYSYGDDYESQPRQNQTSTADEGYAVPVEKIKGCITVYVTDKESQEDSF